MDKDIIVIPAEDICDGRPHTGKILRAAAYCRVSTDEERQLGSFENQIDYFTRMISDNSSYELVKVYSDEGISGCRTQSRKGFLEMIADCEAGLIDLIITKSISRFARNTQDSLDYTRRLKEMGIGVCFEKEGINTLESSGEFLLTLFSCFAQEESRSISENTSWGIRNRFRQGKPHLNVKVLLGYDKDENGDLIINEEQAAVVRRIYRMYMEGFSLRRIAAALNDDGVPGVHGESKWCAVTISRMLRNEKYKGALLMQKTYTANYLTKHQVRNTGQLPQYYIEHDHPAIIPPDEWQAVQEELERRRTFIDNHGLRGLNCGGSGAESPFYSKLFCSCCGGRMQRIWPKGTSRPIWKCLSRDSSSSQGCGRAIDEECVRDSFCKAFNSLVNMRSEFLTIWENSIRNGSCLKKLRAKQMIEITAGGAILYEVPELTRAILQEAWYETDRKLHFVMLSGDEIIV